MSIYTNTPKINNLLNLIDTLPNQSGGVVLPNLEDAADSNHIAKGKQAIGQNGEKITGTLPSLWESELDFMDFTSYPEGGIQFDSSEQKIGLYTLLDGITHPFYLSDMLVMATWGNANELGDATINDVAKGVTFTSKNGLKLEGQLEGGALPAKIKKIATGVYKPTSNETLPYVITHNFGEIPTFAMLFVCDDLSSTALTGGKVLQFQLYKNLKSGNTSYTMRGVHIYGSSTSGSLSTANISDATDYYANTTTATLMGHSTYPFKAGYTYRWVVGILDTSLPTDI